MPVQINEMIIRANVLEPKEKTDHHKQPAEEAVSKEEIIRECTEKILEILQRKEDR